MTEVPWPPPPDEPHRWRDPSPVASRVAPGSSNGAVPGPAALVAQPFDDLGAPSASTVPTFPSPPPATGTPVPATVLAPDGAPGLSPLGGPGGGVTPPPPPPPGGPTGRRLLVDRSPGWLRGIAALVVLALVAGGAYVVTQGGTDYPDNWDPRVEPIARWVAEERGLPFEHPVEVEFLSAEEYTEASGGGDMGTDEETSQEMDDAVALLRALGFIAGDLDLADASKTLSDSGTLAFYDPGTERVYVRGTEMTPALEVTLAHELVHVVQDQRFDLERIGELPDGQASTLRALAEGDAGRIEQAYVEGELSSEEQADYRSQSQTEGDAAMETLDEKVPPILVALFSAPYVFGPVLVDHLEADGGNETIDAALEDPPTEEVLFNPLVYGTAAAERETVEVSPPNDAEEIESGEFGPTTMYLMLASRIDPAEALAATDGMGGDGYSMFRRNDKVCVRAYLTTDTGDDEAELVAALEAWSAQSPDESASVSAADGRISFESCDPGSDSPAVGEVSGELLVLPVSRTQVYAEMLASGATEEQASCLAEGIVERFTVEQLVDVEHMQGPGQAVMIELATGCR